MHILVHYSVINLIANCLLLDWRQATLALVRTDSSLQAIARLGWATLGSHKPASCSAIRPDEESRIGKAKLSRIFLWFDTKCEKIQHLLMLTLTGNATSSRSDIPCISHDIMNSLMWNEPSDGIDMGMNLQWSAATPVLLQHPQVAPRGFFLLCICIHELHIRLSWSWECLLAPLQWCSPLLCYDCPASLQHLLNLRQK